MKQILILVILSIISINLVEGNLVVSDYPKGLGVEFNTPITYSIANYGLIPYGVRSTGPLKIADPLNACEPPEDAYIDGELDLDPQYNDKSNQELSFMLIKRGDCHFTQKSLNAAAAGAKLAIIMDNQIEDDITQIVISDDGRGDNVYIPTIFISEEDGNKLIQLQKAYEVQIQNTLFNKLNPITLIIEFDVQQTDVVDVKFFINPPLRENFTLMNMFFIYWSSLQKTTNFTPIYEFYTCPGCQDSENCIRGGRYCALDMDGDQAGTGRQAAEEYLYQICLQTVTDTANWWKYVSYQHKRCHQIDSWHECSKRYQPKITPEIEQQIEQCMYPNYSKIDTDEEIPILERQLEIRDLSGIIAFPSVTINNVKYRGSIYGKNVVEAVCAYQKNPSSSCQKLINKTKQIVEHQPQDQDSNILFIVSVVTGVLLVIFLFVFFVFRRMVTKEIQKEINVEVNEMVSSYIALSESKNQSKN